MPQLLRTSHLSRCIPLHWRHFHYRQSHWLSSNSIPAHYGIRRSQDLALSLQSQHSRNRSSSPYNADKALNPKDDIVISGMSGRFPKSDSIDEFKANLLCGLDMTTEQTRFKTSGPMPPRFGVVNDLDKFDADFFGASVTRAPFMDPTTRKLLEVAYESILDAGINPETLRGSKTAVIVASDGADPSIFWTLKENWDKNGYCVLGCLDFLQPNQVSYFLDLKGSSFLLSSACSSSLSAIEVAVDFVRSGKCDRAIVAANRIFLSSHDAKTFSSMGATAPDGVARPFDKDASGFVRAEAVVSLLLERKSDALRNYATIVAIGTSSDGMKTEGVFCPSSANQEVLYRQVYSEAGIDPHSVHYLEAHGTGTRVGDPQELAGISNFFCKGRTVENPLLIGSVKSNMGHAEAAAGLCGIAKVLVSAQAGLLPPTLNFKTPNELAAHLFDGTMKVVTNRSPFSGGLIAVNSFGFGGTNGHLILEPNCGTFRTSTSSRASDGNIPSTPKLPSLVPFAGRTEEALKSSLDSACARATDPDFTALVHNIFRRKIPGYSHRGYGIVQNDMESHEPSAVVSVSGMQKLESSLPRPLWFIFSGLGTQWPQMGKELMRVDVFNSSIQKSRVTLKNAGLDLDQLLAPSNTSIFENVHHAFCSIAAVQIALYDTLMSLKIRPDGIFGHSMGEIVCAYADGCLSAEETILCVDASGRASEESKKLDTPGAMAVVGLSWSEVEQICPPGVVPACNNGPQIVTVSGHAEALNTFVSKLKSDGVFAKKVNSCGIASHSPLEVPASKLIAKYVEETLGWKGGGGGGGGGKRERSSRWISTSIPQEQWDSPLAQTASPEYYANNVVKPVLFYEATKHIPHNAVVVEIGPQGPLQSVLRAALPATCHLVAPMQQRVSDRALHFVSSIGDLYNAGVDVDVSALYPPVNFPVSAQTPSISPLVKWNHEQSWTVPIVETTEKYIEGKLNIDLNDQLHKYVEGHKLDDRLVFPATGYLHFAWKSFADSLGVDFKNLPVTFENVSFERAIFLNPENPTHLRFSCQRGSGTFEISENDVTVTRGTIKSKADDSRVPPNIFTPALASHFNLMSTQTPQHHLNSVDIYKELKIRGYNFQKEFQSIQRMDIEGKWAQVTWTGNWVTFLDALIQTSILGSVGCRTTAVPVRLASLTINPSELFSYVGRAGGELDTTIPVLYQHYTSKILAPGIELNRVKADVIQRRGQRGHLAISQYVFTPYLDTKAHKAHFDSEITHVTWEQSTLNRFLDIFLENTPQKHVTVYDVFTNHKSFARPLLTKIFATLPTHEIRLTTMSTEEEISNLLKSTADTSEGTTGLEYVVGKGTIQEMVSEVKDANLVILNEFEFASDVARNLKDNSWIILGDRKGEVSCSKLGEIGLETISKSVCNGSPVFLVRKIAAPPSSLIQSVSIDTDEFSWLPKLQSLMRTDSDGRSPDSRIYITSQKNRDSGIVGLVKCLRAEPGGAILRCISDPEGALNLNFNNPDGDLAEIIQKDLVMNVVQNGELGSYRHLPLPPHFLRSAGKRVKNAFVNPLTIGDLSSLRWIESPLKLKLGAESKNGDAHAQNVCPVSFASLNFKDIMLSTGKLSRSSSLSENAVETQIGLEFSGKDVEGNRIMGMARNALATSVLLDSCSMTWKVPLGWSLEEGATVPVVYATAYYALCDRGRLQPGQSVLIHSGTGGVGQAAINIALSLNCTVFTSVGTEEKQEEIKALFPSLPHDHICNSRDTTFEQQVLELTKGRGVDLVLNSVAEDKLQASLNCLAVGGTFAEIGRFDILRNNPLGMEHLGKSVDVSGVDLIPILSNQIPGKSRLIKLVDDGIKAGVVKPLGRTVFQKEQIEDAFRFMAGGKHMGKVVIQVQPESEAEINVASSWATVEAVSRSYFHPHKTYVIIGGLGGLALEVANWIVERGGKKLVLVSRSGVTNGYQKLCLQRWVAQGVGVSTPQVDLSPLHTARKFIVELLKSGAVLGGIFNSSLVLKDALIENQTREMFEAVCTPKINITQNIDVLTREHCPELDYFVTFSSFSAGLGNAGQSNYGLANSAMEMICHRRKGDGLHGLALQWGVVGDVGVVAEKMNEAQVLDGMNPQRISSCLEVLDALLEESIASPGAVFSSMMVSEKASDQKSVKKISLTEAVHRLLLVKTPLKDVSPAVTINDLGLDSLTGTELTQLLEREFDLSLSSLKIRQMTWAELVAIEQGGVFDTAGTVPVPARGKQFKNSSKYGELVKLHSGNDKGTVTGPLFIVHGGDGEAAKLYTLATKLSCDVYGFDLGPSIIEKGAHLPRLQDLAQEYINDIKQVQPEGPYTLAGYSAGSCIAFEMALQLENKHHDKIQNLILLDGHSLFGLVSKIGMRPAFEFLLSIALNAIMVTLSNEDRQNFLENLDPADSYKNVASLRDILNEKLEVKPGSNSAAHLKLKEAWDIMIRLADIMLTYTPAQTLKGHVTLIKAKSSMLSPLALSPDYNFQEICQERISIHTVAGDHQSFLVSGNVEETGDVLQKILEATHTHSY